MSEIAGFLTCPRCGHPHGQPFDYCRYPKDWKDGDTIPDGPYKACGCPGA